jgi:hypothetical protein
MKITKDNFVWKIVTQEQAEFLFSLGLFELYELHDDDTETLIENYDEISLANKIGIEVGFIDKVSL